MEFPITYLIIGITCAISITAFNRPELVQKYIFNAYKAYHNKEWYRLFSSGLLHADWAHLLINMYVLYMFGLGVEAQYELTFSQGKWVYLLMYALALGASSLYSFYKHKNNVPYNALGASGATSAVVFSMILFAPMTPLRFIFIPFDFPAVLFGVGYLVYSNYAAKKNQDNIGHDAHFWGAVFGFVFPIILKPMLLVDFIMQIWLYAESYFA